MAKKGWFYATVSPNEIIGSSHFLPAHSLDRLSFVHKDCMRIARVIGLRLSPSFSKEFHDTLYIYLSCERCGQTGQLKVDLDSSASHSGQRLYHDGKIFVYGSNGEPERIVEVIKFDE